MKRELVGLLWTVTQPPWAPGCTGQVEGLLSEAKLGGSAAASKGWLTTANGGSKLLLSLRVKEDMEAK